MQRRRFIPALAIALALTAGACTDDKSPTEVSTEVTGTYRLQTVNGQPLPFVLFNSGGFSTSITAQSLTLNNNGSFSQTTTFRDVTPEGTTTEQLSSTGTYSRSGSTITFNLPATQEDPADSFSGTISGNTITLVDAGFTAVLRKD